MMQSSLKFVRIFFVLLGIFFITTYLVATSEDVGVLTIVNGVLFGVLLGAFLIGIDLLFRRFNLRSFNVALIGLFFGYLMGGVFVLFFNEMLHLTEVKASREVIEVVRICLYLFGAYLGIVFTLRSSDEIYVSIPFVKFSQSSAKKKELLLDGSILADVRILDLAASGLLDHHLVLPRFVIKELYAQADTKSMEVQKRLESMPELDLRYHDTDFPEVKDSYSKLLRLARLLDANILTADMNRVQMPVIDGVKMINIHMLASALKPLTQTGELIKIKVQRYGKEAGQGVGYLEDGTMVVINGGADHLSETIVARVLSVKHTQSGRMIFCNLQGEEIALPL